MVQHIEYINKYKCGGIRMDVRFKQRGNTLVVSIAGELDHHSSESIRIKIDNKIDELGAINLIMDFSNVNFMDSSGIGVVIGRYRKVSEFGGKLVVTHLKSQLRKVFELGGLFNIIKESKSVDDAVMSM